MHSRSSPADTCTPPNQKSRVKKKVSKSSAYRRDMQGGEWVWVWIQISSLQQNKDNSFYISVFHGWHFLEFSKCYQKGCYFAWPWQWHCWGTVMFSEAGYAALLHRRKLCSYFVFILLLFVSEWIKRHHSNLAHTVHTPSVVEYLWLWFKICG